VRRAVGNERTLGTRIGEKREAVSHKNGGGEDERKAISGTREDGDSGTKIGIGITGGENDERESREASVVAENTRAGKGGRFDSVARRDGEDEVVEQSSQRVGGDDGANDERRDKERGAEGAANVSGDCGDVRD